MTNRESYNKVTGETTTGMSHLSLTEGEEKDFNKISTFEGMDSNSKSDSFDGPKLPPTAKVAPLLGTHPLRQTTPTLELQRSSKTKLIREGVVNSSTDKFKNLMTLLTEKNQIIEKQKHTISSLQSECKEKDAQLRLLHLPESDSSSLSAPVRLDMLSRKLDEAYYELERAKSEGDLTLEKLTDREKVVSDLEQNIDKLKTINTTLENKISKLEAYLGNTPTMEEHFSLKEQLTQLHSQIISQSENIKEKDYKLESLNKEIKEKEASLKEHVITLSEIKQKNVDLQLRCNSNDKRIVELHSDNSQLKVEIQKLKLTLSELEVTSKQDLRDMRERHRVRFMDATAKLKDQYRTVTKRNRQLELQLMKSSDVMTALNSELKLSQGTVVDLKSSINDLVKQNQELMEKNYGLREPLDTIKSGITSCSPISDSSDDTSLVALNHEMTQCIEEVQSLVSLASSVLEGRDPNMSTLLGVADGASKEIPSHRLTRTDTVDSELLLEAEKRYELQLLQVQKNRKEVERLREIIADHFASQVASECHVQ